jgi:hypothetical protein
MRDNFNLRPEQGMLLLALTWSFGFLATKLLTSQIRRKLGFVDTIFSSTSLDTLLHFAGGAGMAMATANFPSLCKVIGENLPTLGSVKPFAESNILPVAKTIIAPSNVLVFNAFNAFWNLAVPAYNLYSITQCNAELTNQSKQLGYFKTALDRNYGANRNPYRQEILDRANAIKFAQTIGSFNAYLAFTPLVTTCLLPLIATQAPIGLCAAITFGTLAITNILDSCFVEGERFRTKDLVTKIRKENEAIFNAR